MNATETPYLLRLSRLTKREPTEFLLLPKADALTALAAELDLIALRKVRLEGTLSPLGQRDWQLKAKLGATVVQPCSITLAPVTTRIDVPIERRYLAEYAAPTESEAEMPEDDSEEPLPSTLNLSALLAESLAIALPDFPRAEGAELGEAVFAAADATPLRDEDVKPFAGLADLKKQLEP